MTVTKAHATGFAFANALTVLVFAPMQVRLRREILIQTQQILQEIDESEDQLELFQNFDHPAFEAWYNGQFQREKQRIVDLENEYAAAVQFHNSMVALAKLRRVSMPRAYELLRAEHAAYLVGSPSQRARIEEERLKREHLIRSDLNAVTGEVPEEPKRFAPPALPETERIKLIYRKLVRRLHPDLQGPNAELGELRWQKRIWNLAQQARERGDIQEIERLHKVTLLRQMDFSELDEHEAKDAQGWLREELERLKSELWQARQHPAWTFSKVQDLRLLSQSSRESLLAEIQQREEELRELKGQHAYLQVASMKTINPTRCRSSRGRDKSQLSFFD